MEISSDFERESPMARVRRSASHGNPEAQKALRLLLAGHKVSIFWDESHAGEIRTASKIATSETTRNRTRPTRSWQLPGQETSWETRASWQLPDSGRSQPWR
jgi:hypothetical protein